MKSVKQMLVLIAAIGIMASCGTNPEASAKKAAVSAAPIHKIEILEDKGTASGTKTPAWVIEYIMGGNYAVEKLDEYKGKYCFVSDMKDESKDYAIAWVSEGHGSRTVIAREIAKPVLATLYNKLPGPINAAERNIRRTDEALLNANFSGFSKNGDWWQTIHNKTTDITETQAFALYTIDQKILNEQVANSLAQFVKNNAELSAAEREIYAGLIEQIRTAGF